MKNIQLVIFTAIMILSFKSTAAIDCYGIPSFVKMGEYGAQESYVIVRLGDNDYRLGHVSDDATKIRVSIAQTALVTDKEVKLRFYDEKSCSAASINKAIPNSFQLVR